MRPFFHTSSQRLTDIAIYTVSQEDPHLTVQAFVDLVRRHEQMFYSFVHKVHSRGGTLFDNLMKWIELFLTIARDGIGNQTSVEFLLPHTGSEREAVMKELDEVSLYHYKLKLAHEDKLRRRFGRTQKQDGADAEDEAAATLVHGVVNDISFGDLIDGDAEDLAAEESASDDSSDYSTSDEYDSDEESDDDNGTSGESDATDKPPPPPPPKSSRHEQPGGAPSTGYGQNHVGPSHRTRATTMKISRSDAAASSVSLDLGNKEHMSVAQRLRNSKSMEFLRRGKSLDLPPPPPPPIPLQYQPYRSKRVTIASNSGPSPLSQSSSGPLRPPPPTRGSPNLQKKATLATATHVDDPDSSSNHPGAGDSHSSIASTSTTGDGSTSGSKPSLESDRNKLLPDPKPKVNLDPDSIPDVVPQRNTDGTPEVGQKKPKLRKINEQIKPPELTHIPKLLPIFVELVCDLFPSFSTFSETSRLWAIALGEPHTGRKTRLISLLPKRASTNLPLLVGHRSIVLSLGLLHD